MAKWQSGKVAKQKCLANSNACRGKALCALNAQGSVLILSAAALTVLLGIGALAIDAAYLLEIRAELQNAADSVALAASSGLTIGQPEAIARAQQYADLNPILQQPITIDPSEVIFGQWNFTTSQFSPTKVSPNSVRVKIRFVDTANSKELFFAPILGAQQADVGAMATASLGSRDLMLVLDRSGSMNNDSLEPEQPLTDTKTAAKRFLDLIQNFPIQGDQAGLIFYSDGATLEGQLTENFNQIKDAIDPPRAEGWTNIAAALCVARKELNSSRASSRGLKVVILLSDGKTNTRIDSNNCAISGTPGVDSLAAPGNLSEQQALRQARELKQKGVVVYTISLGNDTNKSLMDAMAVETGGEHFHAPTTERLDGVFEQISARIPTVLVE